MKMLLLGLTALAVVWLVACGALYAVMCKGPEPFGRLMARLPGPVPFLLLPFETLWMRARAGTLYVGEQAPDFTLTTLDKTAHVQLSAFTAQRRPVVLIFGSYT